MEGGQRAVCASDEDKCKRARGVVSFHVEQHDQPRVNEQESKIIKGGQRVICASDGDECKGARGGVSFYAEQHDQLRINA